MIEDGDYFLMMRLSRHWGIPYCELVERIDVDELVRQRAFDDLCPIPDHWLMNCKLMELVESLVSKRPISATKRYPGEFFNRLPKAKKSPISRKTHMMAVVDIMNKKKRLGGR